MSVALSYGRKSESPHKFSFRPRVAGVSLLVLIVTITMSLFAVASARASTSYVDGISDQHLYNWESGFSNLFSNAWVGSPPSHIKLARYVVQWNVMSGGGYTNEYSNFKAWYERAGQMGLTREVALADYTGANEPASSEYKTELESLLNEFTGISYVEAWNEPNHHSTGVKFYVEPVAAAHYMNAAYSVCQVHGCIAIAGDFLDESNMSEYEAKYISGSNLNPKDPPNWGIHPYAAVDTRSTVTVEAFRNGLPGKGSESISFTEVGAYYCKKGESVSSSENASREAYQAERASYLVNTLIPHTTNLEHVFYYEFSFEGTKRVNCSSVEDTELYAPASEGQPDQPRSAASIVFGPEGPPSATTVEASGISTTQATLKGSVNPEGLDDTKYYFQYGTTTEYTSGSTTPGDAGQSLNWQSESTPIGGLQPGTMYHFRIVATNAVGTQPGHDLTFMTPSPPSATTGVANGVRQTQAVLNGEVNPNNADTHYYFQYGTNTTYGRSLPTPPGNDAGAGTSLVSEGVTVSGLELATTYHYRLVASSEWGTTYGSDKEFTTQSSTVAFQSKAGDMFLSSNGPGVYTTLGMLAGTSPGIAALPGGGYESAFQNNTGALWVYSSASGAGVSTNLGMEKGTSPSVAASPAGGYDVAFQANVGNDLWVYSSASGVGVNTYEGMLAGTSPSIAALPGGGYVVAFQNNVGDLSVWSSTGSGVNTVLGMEKDTSPSVAASPAGGYDVAFQANAGNDLWVYSSATETGFNTNEGMLTGANPSITALPSGGYDAAFQNNNSDLSIWASSGSGVNTVLGVEKGTTPGIAAASGGGYEVSFQANTGTLWLYSSLTGQGTNTNLEMDKGTNPTITE